MIRATACSLALAAAACTMPAAAAAVEPQDPKTLVERVRAYRAGRELDIVRELAALMALPNVADEPADVQRNAEHLRAMLQRRGIAVRLLEAPGSPPAVYGELPAPGATRTVVFYAHYDGQPADTAEWTSDPWTPVLRTGPLGPDSKAAEVVDLASARAPLPPEWRLFGRSSSDDKGPIVAMLAALDALRAAGVEPSVNLKFFFEGEEEQGSPHLSDMLRRHRELLAADAWILCDGPVHQTRKMQLFYGARGVMGLELTVYGPTRGLHSGHYGNWAPNPAALLAHLLAGLRGPDGTILVAGFGDDVRPLSDSERRAALASPPVEEGLRRDLGLAWTEGKDGERLQETVARPALNVRGLAAGGVGEAARNAIPTEARASIDFRLVPDQRPERVRQLVEAHLAKQGYHVVHEVPSPEVRQAHPRIVRLDWEEGYAAYRAPMDDPAARAVSQVVAAALGERGPAVEAPLLGGSLPLSLVYDVVRVPLLGVPMVNHDNNQHAADENLRLQNLWDGIEIYASLMARLGEAWGEGTAKR